MNVKQIGIIHSPFRSKKDTPIQPSKSEATGDIKIFKDYQEGLDDIEGFSHVILVYKFHKSKGYRLKLKAFLDKKMRGLFSTRYSRRPSQIGLSVVKLLRREGNILSMKGIDVIDGTPLLDIKPYVPDFIPRGKIKIGWLKEKVH